MSDVEHDAPTFLSLYRDGLAVAGQIGDFIDAWHDSEDQEQRPLSQFLGMTEDEYAIWVMSHGALPSILAARRDRRPLPDVIAEYVADLERTRPVDEPAIHALSHWLRRQGR